MNVERARVALRLIAAAATALANELEERPTTTTKRKQVRKRT